ncbi:DoxX family protein [Citrobacter gillenii]|uniref:DoxX family protein n=2 Tax=Citrobacter gillenii TaxID=67828 RepID=A0ABD6M6Y3_9ENTR|nr:DoxX family protein [Citrobacter gillenii]
MNYVQTLVKSTVIGLLARAGLAATFFLSGQSKVEGLQIDILGGSHIELGFPHVTTNAIDLFRDEYRLPLLSPELAATLSASAEHLFPILLILGLATRFSALALMIMTLVIQLLVYPDAWPVHAIWLAAQLHLMSYGAGQLSLDHLIFRRR